MPRPEDFAERARFRVRNNQMEAELDGVIYNVDPYGNDAIEIVEPDTFKLVAVLTAKDGKFVVPGA